MSPAGGPWSQAWVAVGLLNAAIVSAATASVPMLAEALTVNGRAEAAANFYASGFVVALGHAIIIGAPAYAALRNRLPPRWYVGLAGGAIIGVLPLTLITLPMQFWSPATSASVGGTPTVVDHVTTVTGWLEWLQLEAMVMAIGAIGGVAFWLTFKAFAVRTKAGRIAASSFAVLAVTTAMTAPVAVHDRSCHQLMTHGRSSIGQSFGMTVNGDSSQWPAVKQALKELAQEQGWITARTAIRP